MQNDHKTQDPGHSFGRSDDREKLATWPASLVSELAENRRVRFGLDYYYTGRCHRNTSIMSLVASGQYILLVVYFSHINSSASP